MATPSIRTETQGPLVTGITIGFTVASAAFVALRLYTRLFMLRLPGYDDWTILATMVFAVIVGTSTCLEVKYGMGRHSENVTPEEGIEQLKFLLVTIIDYNMGMNMVKISFLFQYRRIFQSKPVQTACFWCMMMVVVWACVQAIILSLSCLPISFIVPSTAGFCLDTLPVWYFSSAMSLVTDVVIFCIPLPSVFNLQLRRKQKALLFGVFCLGFFVCIISVYRMFTLRSAVFSQDPSWENIGAAIWSVIELNTAIICSCLPTLRPLLAKWVPGGGLSSAHNDRSAYERYGSASRMHGGDTFKGTKSGGPRSISTEELALKDMLPPSNYSSDAGAAPVVYTHVASDGRAQGNLSRNDHRGILRTTETTIIEHQ